MMRTEGRRWREEGRGRRAEGGGGGARAEGRGGGQGRRARETLTKKKNTACPTNN
jgi:hypothetical protein